MQLMSVTQLRWRVPFDYVVVVSTIKGISRFGSGSIIHFLDGTDIDVAETLEELVQVLKQVKA